MMVKKLNDHKVLTSPTCGEIREILKDGEYKPLGIAIALDITPTRAHFHNSFDEIYFVLDGSLKLELYDPVEEKLWTETLNSNELCVVPKGTHHKVIEASIDNRLCVISVPPFHADDEHLSNRN
jgi:mannose-6-phosphate isomerase-like protein (cupin superfamily)